MATELTLVIPTFNESGNLRELLRRVDAALTGVDWEMIVVDDNSPDGTSTLAKEISREDSRVRCLRRVNRRGLAGACIEGMLASSAPVVAVMDADLQHDETHPAADAGQIAGRLRPRGRQPPCRRRLGERGLFGGPRRASAVLRPGWPSERCMPIFPI